MKHRIALGTAAWLIVACGGKQTDVDNPAEHLDSPIALCGAGITFSNEVKATLNGELGKRSAQGGLTAEFKRAARTAVELQDDTRYSQYLTCVCKQSNIDNCDSAPPTDA